MSTDITLIESVLTSVKVKCHQHPDGFGYHCNIPGIKQREPYIDLWLYYDKPGNMVQCVGIRNQCMQWCKKFKKEICSLMPKTWFYPPMFVPYGPYLMATPRIPFLNMLYSNNWNVSCKGWDRGNENCTKSMANEMFVESTTDKNGNVLKIAKIDNKIHHIFIVKDEVYNLL